MVRILRIFSYLYQLALAVLFLGLAAVTIVGGARNLNLPMFPWRGAALTWWLFALSLTGILVTLLAMTGRLRYLYPFWCAYVLAMMVWWLFLAPRVTFSGAEEFNRGLWMLAGALVSFLASLSLFRSK